MTHPIRSSSSDPYSAQINACSEWYQEQQEALNRAEAELRAHVAGLMEQLQKQARQIDNDDKPKISPIARRYDGRELYAAFPSMIRDATGSWAERRTDLENDRREIEQGLREGLTEIRQQRREIQRQYDAAIRSIEEARRKSIEEARRKQQAEEHPSHKPWGRYGPGSFGGL